MILEGAMVTIASTCLTLIHPGVAFQGSWSGANFTFRKRRDGDLEKVAQVEGESYENTLAEGPNIEVRDMNVS